MLDRLHPDYFDSDRVDEAYASSSDTNHSQTREKLREYHLQRREGKSATRTVKQAMAIKHSKALKNAHE
ncbi:MULTISPECIES: hypothetical protein [unclassified Methylophilus]|uniref:hypothetical protein n=1 Tax=unclassified Methylophilus TaxID=2630143 RepID=UPI0006F4B5B5|nr:MULTISPECIES: hypothetical protein [unclassified Methylophilus]KQT42412.1 hypothetical protein ASG34_06610 [Methylophilus sp. Leaf416]KQT56595.1 hypothetical protein ASG44_06585 [Methylophilus sp. Leaf459]